MHFKCIIFESIFYFNSIISSFHYYLQPVLLCVFLEACSALLLQFFPYILLLVAVMMYTPALFWRFSAAHLLQSDLSFIIEELDRCYNRAVTLAKRMASSGVLSPER